MSARIRQSGEQIAVSFSKLLPYQRRRVCGAIAQVARQDAPTAHLWALLVDLDAALKEEEASHDAA